MESTISNLIFPRPANPSYGINTTLVDGYPEARLVHIRRRETHKYTFGFYVSQTLKYNFECEREKESFIQEQQQQQEHQQYQYTYVGKTAAEDEEKKKEESKDGCVASPLGGGGEQSDRHNPYRDAGESDEEQQISNLRNSSQSASSPEENNTMSPPSSTQRDGSGQLSQARTTTTTTSHFVAPPPPPPPRYLVLYAHPNACDIGDMLYDASALSSIANVDVLVWEFRGYGLCGGAASERELYLDMEAVYDFAENSLGIPSHQIILAGRSVGSGPSVQLAACLPTILNARRLSSQRSAERELDAQRGELPLYRFEEETAETTSSSSKQSTKDGREHFSSSSSSSSSAVVPLRRLPLAGLFLQGAFTSISDAVDSLIDFYSGSSGVLSYTKGITKGLAKKVVAERFRSVDIIPEVFSFEQQYYSKSEIEKKKQKHHHGGGVVGEREDGFPLVRNNDSDNKKSNNRVDDGMSAVNDENTLALAKRIWSDTVSNYCSPPFMAIQHGDKDEIVPHTHALGLMKAIEKRCNGGGSNESSSAANLSPSSRSYKTIYKGRSVVNLRTAEGVGHNDLSIEDAAAIILRDIIQPHAAMLEVLSAAYAHNESFLKTLDFPSPAVVSLVSVVEDVLPKYVVGGATGISDGRAVLLTEGHPSAASASSFDSSCRNSLLRRNLKAYPPASYFSTVYSKIVFLLGEEVEAKEAANNNTPHPLLLESARLRAGHGLLAMATSSASSPPSVTNEEGEGGCVSTKTSPPPASVAASKVPGVNAPAFDEDGYLFAAKSKQQRQLAQQSASTSTGKASTEAGEPEPSGREDFSLMVAGDGKRVIGVRSRTEAPEAEGFNPMGFANMAKELWKEPITTTEIKKGQDADEEDEEDALAVKQATPTTTSGTVPDEAHTLNNNTEEDRVGGERLGTSSKSPSTTTAAAVAVAKLSPLTRPTLSYWTRAILPSTDGSRFGAILLSSCLNSTATAVATHGGNTKNTSSFFRVLVDEAAKSSRILITSKRSCHALTAHHGAHREGKHTTTDNYPHALSTTPARQQQPDSTTSPLTSTNRHHTTKTTNTNSNSNKKNGCVHASPYVALDLIAPSEATAVPKPMLHNPPADNNNDLLHSAHFFGQSLLAGNHPPSLLSSAVLQKQLAAVLTTSVLVFTQHVAMRWLRMRAKRDLVQLRLRGAKTSAYGFSAGSSSSTTPTAAAASGSLPPGLALAVVGAGNTAPGALPPTALPPLQSPREFVYEHLALFGSPFGVYLLPVIMGKDSNMRDGLKTNRAEQEHNEKAAAKTKSSPPSPSSSGFHAVIFGSFVADPASLTAEEARRECLSETGGAMLSPNTPYKCWYTHCVELSDEQQQDEAADSNSASNFNGSNGVSGVKSYSSSRRMKRMVERFPRVTMMELELTENILTTIERFLTTLDHKAALGDLAKAPAFSSSSSSSFDHLAMQTDDFLISGERHLDDLCGAMAVENSLMLLGESEVDRVQMECERLVLALTQREIEALTNARLTTLKRTNDTRRDRDRDSNGLAQDLLIKAMPIATILCPFVRLLATKPPMMSLANNKDTAVTGTTASNKKEEASEGIEVGTNVIQDDDPELASSSMYDLDDTREGYLIPRLYGPSAFVSATHMLLPPTVIVRLYKSFSHDFFNTTGDLSRVLADVKRRRLQFEACHPMFNVGGKTFIGGCLAHSERTMPDECQLDSLIFDLQSALLRNVPEGFCGSVGCGRYRDADEAVCLLQELCLKAFVEAETYKLPYSTCRTEVLKPSLGKRERAEREKDGDEEEAFEIEVEGMDGNCRFIASPVGGSDAAKRHVLLGRAEPADPCIRDALHWIMPPSNLSAAATESNNDCVIC